MLWIVIGAELVLLVVAAISAIKYGRRRQRWVEESRRGEARTLLGDWPDSFIQTTTGVSDAELATLKASLTRAENLLQHIVGKAGFGQISEHHYYEVASRRTPGWTYRVYQGGVEIHDESAFLGTICIAASADLAWPDQILTLILMARYQEARLLRVGNVSWTSAGRASVRKNWLSLNQR